MPRRAHPAKAVEPSNHFLRLCVAFLETTAKLPGLSFSIGRSGLFMLIRSYQSVLLSVLRTNNDRIAGAHRSTRGAVQYPRRLKPEDAALTNEVRRKLLGQSAH